MTRTVMMKWEQLKLLVCKGRVVRVLQGFYYFNVLATWQNTLYIYIIHLMVYLLYSSQ